MLVGTQSLPDQPRPLHILLKEVIPRSNRHMPMWQMPNDVKYCQQLPTVQAADNVATKWLRHNGS